MVKQVADDLAAANISVILSENRPAPDVFRDGDAVVGPPLTRSVASYLKEAGVTFALAIFETGKHSPKAFIKMVMIFTCISSNASRLSRSRPRPRSRLGSQVRSHQPGRQRAACYLQCRVDFGA